MYQVSEQMRLIETEIDNHYKENLLMQSPFAAAAWWFMAFCEDWNFIDHQKRNRRTIHDVSVFADGFVMHLKNAFLWLRSSCGIDGSPQCIYREDMYQAAWDLSQLSENYKSFESAFTYASRGLIELSLSGSTIIASTELQQDTKYEVYDRLVKPEEPQENFDIQGFYDLVSPTVQVTGAYFTYRLSPRVVSRAEEMLEPVLAGRHTLPHHWQLSRYSIQDFRRVASCLTAIAFVHNTAHIVAAMQGCVALGYTNSVFLASPRELINRLVRYSGCTTQAVEALVEDMTYGSKDITAPDPAIQPLIKLNEDTYALMPSLLINSAMERNFAILLNKLPQEKAIYSGLVGEKESFMRDWITDNLTIPYVRYFNGSIRSARKLGDIDLAMISDKEKVCIILEMKWFIEPAEEREVIEKSEEINKGVSQMLRLSDAMKKSPNLLFEALNIDESYKLVFAVASDSFIGMASVQHPQVPVLRHRHLVKKGNLLGSLQKLSAWLLDRDYLPCEGKDYEIVETTSRIGRWGIKWYGTRPLIDEEFI